MAKTVSQKKEKAAGYLYPSRFGSHKSMIMAEESKALDRPDQVVLQDEFGLYTTFINRLDNGEADPRRYAESRLVKLHEEAKRLTAKLN